MFWYEVTARVHVPTKGLVGISGCTRIIGTKTIQVTASVAQSPCIWTFGLLAEDVYFRFGECLRVFLRKIGECIIHGVFISGAHRLEPSDTHEGCRASPPLSHKPSTVNEYLEPDLLSSKKRLI